MTAAAMTGPPDSPVRLVPAAATAAAAFPGLADPRIGTAQILSQLGGELPAGRVHRPRRRDRCQDLPGLACGDLARHAVGHQLAQHLVQPQATWVRARPRSG